MEPNKVLVLNRSFEPLQVCDARRAIVLLFTGRAERIEDTADLIRSPSVAILIPSVIRLQRYIRRPPTHILSFNKKNILKRDGYTCLYCGRNGGERMTIDHVVPRFLGGKTIWENVVSACRTCNTRKGNRTPQQAGMRLPQKPSKPISALYLTILAQSARHLHVWQKYLPAEAVRSLTGNGIGKEVYPCNGDGQSGFLLS
ncbi:MAG: HNH endonuclease [candidate division NC10 bacterium]|nr:HNH endonuclease [candidate division NC10 bacterium]MCH7896827.1 HNH endonuclease [candidate division NC10 bacterium]MCZ6551171.1 HNH endonuclease [candidate division NC10 bacterium]